MYGKIFNRFSQGCHHVKESSKKLQQRSRPILTTTPALRLDKTNENNQRWIKARASRSCKRLNLPPLSEDKSNHVSPSSNDKINLRRSSSLCSEKDFEKKSNVDSQKNHLSTKQHADKFWMSFITSPQYINWLKVGLALRSVREFVSPVVDEVVICMHTWFMHNHGLLNFEDHCQLNVSGKNIKNEPMRKWIQDVLIHHRNPPKAAEVQYLSNIDRWPTKDGAWEIARVFMSKHRSTRNTTLSASSCDVADMLKFMCNCKLVDGYVRDLQNVKELLKVRNSTMHNPQLVIDDETRDENFDVVLNFLNDSDLVKHAGRYLETSSFIRNVEELKTFEFDLFATAKHSLALLKDHINNTKNENPLPAAKEIASLRRALERFLIWGDLQLNDSFGLTSPWKWKDLHRINRRKVKLNNSMLPYERIKTTRDDSDPVPRVSAAKSKASTSDSSSEETTITDESDPDAEHSIRLSALVQGSTSFHSPIDCMRGMNNPYNSMSESAMLSSKENLSRNSGALASAPGLGSSSSLMFVPSANPTPFYSNAPAIKRKFGELFDPIKSKRKKNSSDKNSVISKDLVPNKLIPIPMPKRFGGSGGSISYQTTLQNFLRKQPNNPGALFTLDKKGGTYRCDVAFQSNYAISSRVLSMTEEESILQAAIEARRWVLGDYRVKDGATAKLWFDAYATQVVGRKPVYTCTKIDGDRYQTYIHLMNNHLFTSEIDDASSFKLFLEASCVSSNPSVDVESAVVTTALQGIKIPMNSQSGNRKMLNEFCLENGGTIPVVHTCAIWHPRTAKMSWKSSLRSFMSRSLSQDIEQLDSPDYGNEKKTASDAFLLARVYADFITAESTQAQKTPVLAEESAASVLLEKLGCPLKHILANQGLCKRQLEVYVYEMDYSVVYHTVHVNDKNEEPKYECVVATTCLYDTRNKFNVAGEEKGFSSEEAACESAAKNALRLLGIETAIMK